MLCLSPAHAKEFQNVAVPSPDSPRRCGCARGRVRLRRRLEVGARRSL